MFDSNYGVCILRMMDGLDIAEELESAGNCMSIFVFLFSSCTRLYNCISILVFLLFACTRLVNNDYSVYLIANQASETDETIESDQSQNSEIESGKEILKLSKLWQNHNL